MKKIVLSLVLALTCPWVAAGDLGDYAPGTNICGKFTTYQPSTGASFALAGSPVLSAYKDNSTTQSTTGVTLTASFDSVTGLNQFCVDTSADGTFYSAGSNFEVVITTGTVDSVSVVGSVVGNFSLYKVAALRPATVGRTLVVSASGIADSNISQVNAVSTAGPTGARIWGIDRFGTAAAVAAGTLTMDSGAAYGDNTLVGATIWGCGSTQGYCQFNTVASNVGATDVLTLSANWPVTPSGTVTYYLWGTAASTGGSGLDAAGVRAAVGLASANLDTQLGGIQSDTDNVQTRLPAALSGGRMDSATNAMAADVITNTAVAASAVTEIQSGLATSASITSLAGTLTTMDGKLDTIDTVADAINAKTSQLTFGVANTLNSNVTYQNEVQICGDGSSGDRWRACP